MNDAPQRAFDVEDKGIRLHSRGGSRPSLASVVALMKTRGRREGRVTASPAAPVHNKRHGEGTTGSAGSSGIPCAMVLMFMSCSPWGPGCLAPIARIVRHVARLASASGGQDHTSLRPQRRRSSARESRAPPLRPPHPRLTCRDDRDTSLYRGGIAGPYF